ncbi:ABC transporter ATP-binding protein [Bailinhaonella thermotolerans]|uniref:ABC transporter ATP-binding protein n=1 Tax=Bailinhaonella thermotolerans TaxID=1070861 RepID=A0A3A4AGF3_9ACTN|nr:ABC transporter ATP-binding protein [Bailinhaonella thermotolerans]
METDIVAARGVRVELGGRPVLDAVDLTAGPGRIVAVTGENGAGKSTLLRCLAGLETPSAGRVEVLGGPPADTPAFWRDVAQAADEPAWYPGLSVREHLELALSVHGRGRLTAEGALTAFGLEERADLHPLSLSTGQRQRLTLAMALIRPSRLLLLDEPERGLDAAFRERLAGLLREYAGEGGAVVMATHDLALARDCGARLAPLGEAR